MTRAVTFVVPGDLETPTGGYVYDRRIVGELRAMGWDVDVVDLGEGFPFPDDAMREKAEKTLAAIPSDRIVIIDGLALGVLTETASALKSTHRVIALVHHPLAYESGLEDEQKTVLHKSEREALAHVHSVIVTSDATKRLVAADYGVAPDSIAVVKPGNERVALASGGGEPLSLLAVGSVVPRKGYDVLVAALAMLKDLSWTLTIAGDRTRDFAATMHLSSDIRRHDLEERITLTGAVSDGALARMYSQASVFVLASRFEGYGMALADATAYGLPVVATNAGAIPEAVPADASILVPPDDAVALADALRRVISDKSERDRLAGNARVAASRLPQWRDQAILFARAIEAAA